MGSAAKSSSSSNSTDYSNSNNTTVTQSLGAGAAGVLGNVGGAFTNQNNSNNTTASNNTTGSYNSTYADTFSLGAGSTANGSSNSPSASVSGSDPSDSAFDASGIDWNEVVVYVVGGVILYYLIKYMSGGKGTE